MSLSLLLRDHIYLHLDHLPPELLHERLPGEIGILTYIHTVAEANADAARVYANLFPLT
jgi:hypothetical protein